MEYKPGSRRNTRDRCQTICRMSAPITSISETLGCCLRSTRTWYKRQRWVGTAASGGSTCSSTTPFTRFVSAASFPDRPKSGSCQGLVRQSWRI